MVDATVSCPGGGFRPSVAPGPGNVGYVGLTTRVTGASLPFHPQLIRIDPAAAIQTVDMDPIQAVFTHVATDSAGVPYVFGDEVGGGLAVGYAARTAGGWATETFSPKDSTQYFIFDAAIGGDGRAFGLFAPQSGAVYLGTRAAAGGWSLDMISPTHAANSGGLALGTAGQVYTAYEITSGGQHLLQLQQGTSAPQLVSAYTGSTISSKVDAVAPAGSAPVVSTDVSTSAGQDIHVFTPSAADGYLDIAVPGTKLQANTGCENAGCTPPEPTTCTSKAETTFLGAEALASTSDGVIYFAFTRRHVDFDSHFESVQTMPPVVTTICNKVMDADRSTTELVVARVPAGGGTTLTESFHADLGNIDGDVELDADARGHNLYLVVVGSRNVYDARYLLLDTTKLP